MELSPHRHPTQQSTPTLRYAFSLQSPHLYNSDLAITTLHLKTAIGPAHHSFTIIPPLLTLLSRPPLHSFQSTHRLPPPFFPHPRCPHGCVGLLQLVIFRRVTVEDAAALEHNCHAWSEMCKQLGLTRPEVCVVLDAGGPSHTKRGGRCYMWRGGEVVRTSASFTLLAAFVRVGERRKRANVSCV